MIDIATPAAYKQLCAFKGEENNPLLAPRGVFLYKDILVVADTGQNRVFIWKNFSYNSCQRADVILGQSTQAGTGRNAGLDAGASTLQYPSGVWTNGQMLIVADAWNHRVLIWQAMPECNGQPADTVIGQRDFYGNEPNVLGTGKPCSQNTLYWPYGVWSNGNQLWIADTGNRRVLFYNSIPCVNFAPADAVIGQEDFLSRDFNSNNAVWPYAVTIGPLGELAIADTQFYRVLLWRNWQEAFTKPADVVIGQTNIEDGGQNQFQLKPSAHTLNWCYCACFYRDGLAVADTGNSRVLLFDNIPETNNAAADTLVGQTNFETNGESSLSLTSKVPNQMYWPFAVNTCNEKLVIADTGNHRVLVYKPVSHV